MPALTLFGRQWHACTDQLPLLGGVLVVFNATLLAVYVVFLLLFSRPVGCSESLVRQNAVVYGTLSLFVISLVLAVALVWIGCRGTPFEPSKRRAMAPVLYLQSAKWALLLGWLPFAIWSVYSSPAQCWKSSRRTETVALLWSTVGVTLGLYVVGLLTYNFLSKDDPESRWQKRVAFVSKLLGGYKVLQSAELESEGGSTAALQEIASSFARFFGATDLEESDVVAGFVLAEVMQVQQRRARVAAALRRHKVPGCNEALLRQLGLQGAPASSGAKGDDWGRGGAGAATASQLNGQGHASEADTPADSGGEGSGGLNAGAGEGTGAEDGWESSTTSQQAGGYVQDCCAALSEERGAGPGAQPDGAAGVNAAEGDGSTGQGPGAAKPCGQGQQQQQQQQAGHKRHHHQQQQEQRAGKQQQAGQQEQQQEEGQAGGRKGHGRSGSASDPGQGQAVAVDVDGPLYQWMRDISEGKNFTLTPSGWGAKLAPGLSPQQCAELYTGSTDYVSRADLQEAQHWYKYAVAAYGSKGWIWTRPKFLPWTALSYWRKRAQLRASRHPGHRVVADAKPPVQQKLKESKSYLKHYVGASKVAGATHDDFVYVSFTNAPLGSTPYIIVLDRPSRTVVLAIRGSQSFEDFVTDMVDRPVDVSDWVPEELKQEFQLEGEVKAHAGMLSAAKAVLQDLNKHQILPILLLGEPLPKEERERQHAVHAADERDQQAPAWRRSVRSMASAAPRQPQQGEAGRRGAPAGYAVQGGGDGAVEGQQGGPRRPATPPLQQQQEQQGGAVPEPTPQQGGLQRYWSQPLWHGPTAARALSWVGRLSQPYALGSPVEGTTGPVGMGRFDSYRDVLQEPTRAPTQPPLQRPPSSRQPGGDGAASGGAGGGGGPQDHHQQQQPQQLQQPEVAAPEAVGGAGPAQASLADGESKAASGTASPTKAKAEGVAEGAARGGGSMEEELGPEDYQELLRERGLECRGWNLVVTGHSLGAAVAALVGMHFRSWCPGVKVWSFNPPGGMATLNLSTALQGFVTSLVVGKDAISRTGTVTFERLVDQVVVALARTRLCKMRVLLQAWSSGLRQAPAPAVFRPVEEIPPEALQYVREYFESKCRFRDLFVPMFPPGRTMQLRRLRDAHGWESWDAVWIRAEQIMEEGVLLSRHQTSDHYTARLTEVLAELVGEKGGPRGEPGAAKKP